MLANLERILLSNRGGYIFVLILFVSRGLPTLNAYCSDLGFCRQARLVLFSDACQLRLHIARIRSGFIVHGLLLLF